MPRVPTTLIGFLLSLRARFVIPVSHHYEPHCTRLRCPIFISSRKTTRFSRRNKDRAPKPGAVRLVVMRDRDYKSGPEGEQESDKCCRDSRHTDLSELNYR